MLNLLPQQTLQDVAEGLDQMDSELLKTYMTGHPSGLQVLASPSRPLGKGALNPDDVLDTLRLVASTYEYVIADVPTSFDEQTERVLRASTYILLVTSLEVASIRAAKRYLDAMKHWEFARDKIKIIMNAANSANSVGKSDIEEVLGFPVFWKIPYDTNAGMASQVGQSLIELHPNSKATQSISALHYALTGIRPSEKKGPFRLFGKN